MMQEYLNSIKQRGKVEGIYYEAFITAVSKNGTGWIIGAFSMEDLELKYKQAELRAPFDPAKVQRVAFFQADKVERTGL